MTKRRIRSTWNVKASPAAAMPSEAGDHPAAQPDPDVEEYGVGFPSDWAEDPHPGPYDNAPAPAMPSEAGDHPAARTAAAQMRYAAEKKAFDCVLIAERLLGKNASSDAIQRQAMAFMHMEDDMVSDTLDNMAMYDDGEEYDVEVYDDEYDDEYALDEEEMMLAAMLAEEADSDDEEEGKTASASKTADEMLAEMLAKHTASDDEDEDDDESGKEADQNDPDGDTLSPDVSDEVEDAEEEAGKSAGFDPMGLDGQSVTAEDLFNEYFGERGASDDEDSDEEEEEAAAEEEVAKEAKKASQRPRPRKPSTGPKTLGKVASSNSDSDPLASIWETAPDVSEAFGMKSRS